LSGFSARSSGQLYMYSWLSCQTQQVCTVLQDAMTPSGWTAKMTTHHTALPMSAESKLLDARVKERHPKMFLTLCACCSCTSSWESVCTPTAHSHAGCAHQHSVPGQVSQRQCQQQKKYLPLCCPARQQLGMQTGGGLAVQGWEEA
jgi:hypothetical protein